MCASLFPPFDNASDVLPSSKVADMEGRVTVLNVSNALADPPLDAVADLDKALGALAADAE